MALLVLAALTHDEAGQQRSFRPTFAGFWLFCRQDRGFDRLEQREFALTSSKARSKPPIEDIKALHSADLGTLAQASGIPASGHRLPHDQPAHAGADGARSRVISDRMSANICRGTATSAIWINVAGPCGCWRTVAIDVSSDSLLLSFIQMNDARIDRPHPSARGKMSARACLGPDGASREPLCSSLPSNADRSRLAPVTASRAVKSTSAMGSARPILSCLKNGGLRRRAIGLRF